MNELADRARARAAGPVKELNDAVLALVEREGPMKAQGMIFALLALPAVAELGNAYAEPMLQSHLLGRLEAPHSVAPLELKLEPRFTALDPQGAIDFFQRKQPMSPAEFGALEDRYKAKGFAMAGVHARGVLDTAYNAIGDSLKTGTSSKDAQQAIKSAFASAGLEDAGDFHVATTVDTALLGSYAAGRYEQMTDPDVVRARPYWEYRTVGDNRVRATHRAMNERVFPADSEVWQTWYPPNGFNCRCGVVSLSEAELEQRGLLVHESLPHQVKDANGRPVQMLPDPGFSGSPATQLAADRTVERIRTDAHGAGILGQGPDDLNRAADAERRRRIDAFSGLSPDQVERQLAESFVFNVSVEGKARPPAPGQLAVDWHMYSPNLETAEQLVTRAVQERGLYKVKDRIDVGARATYFGDWEKAAWPDPEVVYDDALGAKLGLAEGHTVARSTEYAIRMHVTPGELEHALTFLDENGERGPGKLPVRRAWEAQDVRVTAGAGVELPEGAKWKKAIRNERQLPGGKTLVTLSRKPLAGWSHSAITINASLWEFLS